MKISKKRGVKGKRSTMSSADERLCEKRSKDLLQGSDRCLS